MYSICISMTFLKWHMLVANSKYSLKVQREHKIKKKHRACLWTNSKGTKFIFSPQINSFFAQHLCCKAPISFKHIVDMFWNKIDDYLLLWNGSCDLSTIFLLFWAINVLYYLLKLLAIKIVIHHLKMKHKLSPTFYLPS